MRRMRAILCFTMSVVACSSVVVAEAPSVSYIFPAGGRRGTTVSFKVGGHYLYDSSPFEMRGSGVEASRRIERTETLWFEGPVIPKPDSQKEEDYPQDYAGTVQIAPDAPLGSRYWQVWNSQGATPAMKFVVGDLPEVVEQEIDGSPISTHVALPVTINGRIFPREDVDIWTFDAKAGQTITCDVRAAGLGSPLDARLEVRGPSGERLAENGIATGTDGRARFRAPRDGTYRVAIHDVNFGGLQHYVYRLTITAGPSLDAVYPLGGRRGTSLRVELMGANVPGDPVAVDLPKDGPAEFPYRYAAGNAASNVLWLDLDDLPESLEQEVKDPAGETNVVPIPAVLNGRISQPGEADVWRFDATAGVEYVFELYAARFGSPLDSVLTLLDASGKELATADDQGDGQTDSRLSFKTPAVGRFAIRVNDRLASRGGREFGYRLKAKPVSAEPDFAVTLPESAVSIERGKEAKLKIAALRSGGFDEPIDLIFEGLPAGVTAEGTTIAKGASEAQVILKAAASARIQAARIAVQGKSRVAGREITRRATGPAPRGETGIDSILLATTIATPFRLRAQFEQKFASRGGVYLRHYTLERNGFEGPITIEIGDRQVRHKQGVTGPVIVIPPGVDEFDYPLQLSTFMEVGRTSRTNVAAIGELADADGSKHTVSFSTFDVTEQIICLTDPCRTSVESPRKSLRARPGETVRIPITVGRRSGLDGPMTVELRVASHIRGVSSSGVDVPAGETQAELPIAFATGELEPFNMPLTIRATMKDELGYPLIAETPLTIVPAK